MHMVQHMLMFSPFVWSIGDAPVVKQGQGSLVMYKREPKVWRMGSLPICVILTCVAVGQWLMTHPAQTHTYVPSIHMERWFTN